MCLLSWSSMNKILPSMQPNIFLWCLERISYFLKRKNHNSTYGPIIFVHFDLPHTNASLRMMFSRNRCWSTLWRTTLSMHDHTMTWKFCKSSDINFGRILRSHSLSLPILPCPLKCIMACCLTLVKSDYKVDHQRREGPIWRALVGDGTHAAQGW